ncbi:MAG: glycoside hydrolase family 3 C-terminal domain-containing protein [Bacteroidales bacterium]|nr:glycoside hydrolase family 3 C-terminal domain-containing protein [Bacteroidales bacterium]MCM1414901.1 glycoside hydrolase family 3 C-terminal domain-containing protein [bacterium]MCM1423942.1 glycoside hydrolase family 3 C-terminal domain-containing protein [bacterium]
MSENYMDTGLAPKERAKLLLAELSMEEKMAQVNTVFPFDAVYMDFDYISGQTPYGIGEVSTLEMRRMETLEDAAQWQRKVQKIVMDNSPHHIPAIFHMEGLCGAFIQDTTSFPAGIGRGSGFDPELEEKIAEIVSRQEAACGITHVLAPVLDISRDSRMGRQGETYGEDPALAAVMGAAYTRGIQKAETAGRKTESVAKHFLAFHNSQGGIHGTHADTPPRLLQEIYGKPFQAAIVEADLKGVMPCYCSVNGEPLSASHGLLTELLRDDMGFDGLCISDYGGISGVHNVQHVAETMGGAGALCMEAGMDIEMPSTTGYGDELKEMFKSGKADIAILDRAVLRVLTEKFRMGLFENPYSLEGEELRRTVCREEDREISLQSAKESLILLKNEGALPIRQGVKKIALIGPHADCARKFFGGYTHMCMMESTYAIANSIAGVSGSENTEGKEIVTIPGTNIQSDETEEFDAILRRQKPECRSLLEEMKGRMPETEIIYAYGYPIAGTDESRFEEALQAVREADTVILTLGGKHGTCSMASMGEGVDASNINLPPCQEAFIRKAAKMGKPLVGVHFDGRPISGDAADECLDAILEAWSPAETGAEAVVDALLGNYNPGGKLPVSVAYCAGQIPIYYNHPNGSAWHQGESIGFVNYVDLPHTPRYCFGHGLSYTNFTYSDLKISEQEIAPHGKLRIEAVISNIGDREGDEVVQLYLRDRFASMTRPVKELAGFQRISLKPGEKRKVVFEVAASQMAFLDKDMRWRIEKGTIDVEIGSSSEDIRLAGAYEVTETGWIAGRDRKFYAAASVE